MNNKIVKPITLLRDDFIKNIANVCNNSQLPFFVMEDVLVNLIKEVDAAAKQQLERDTKNYQLELDKIQNEE